MMSRRGWLIAALPALAVGLGVTDASAAAKYDIDPENSTVIFKVKNRDISHIYGRFNKMSGTIKVNSLRKPTEFEFSIEIQAGSIDTNAKKRDRDLKGTDFLNARKFRTIVFKGKTAKKLEENRYELAGQLDILGAKRDLTIVFQFTGGQQLSQTEFRIGGESTFTVKRSELGISHLIPEIADEVTIMVNIEGVCVLLPAG